jgi:hypothetical protein
MTVRNDLTINWELSPRIVTVAAPSTEITIQDLHDTLTRAFEDSLEGHQHPNLISSAGKEPLGGGVEVGITSTLQNTLVSFERRVTPEESGTATSTGTTTLTDTSATFVTNGVARGAFLVNYTDNSKCTVISVISETQLEHETLVGGIANDWTIGDAYDVTNEVQCNISGGNLTAVDDVGADMDPIFPTIGTQVVRAASSSATTQNQEALEAAAFGGGVAYDPTSSNTGTDFPMGTREFPLNNIMDVHAVSQNRGLRDIFVISNATVTTMDMSSDKHRWVGDSRTIVLTIDVTADTTNNAFENLTVAGDLGGNNSLLHCDVNDGTSLGGIARNCAFNGETTLLGGTELESCVSGVTGTGHPDFVVGTNTFQVSDWHRSLGIHSVTAGTHTIEIYGGRLHLDSGCTGGTVHLRGAYHQTADDLSAGTTLLDESAHQANWAYSKALTVTKWLGLR